MVKKKKDTNKNKVTTKRKTKKQKVQEKRKKKIIIYASIIAIIILAITAIIIFKPFSNPTTETEEIAAYVNGFIIYMSEMNAEYMRIASVLPSNADPAEVKKAVLFNMINEQLMIINAEEEGLTATDEEVEQEIDKLVIQYGITKEEFDKNLNAQGIDLEEGRNRIKKQMLIAKLIQFKKFENIQATEEEIEKYIANNDLDIKELVTTKHILVSTDTRTEEEAEALINTIKQEFDANNSKFCELVEQYSEDSGSIENCGLYSAEMLPQFVPEFQEVAYNNKEGEANIAKTQFGFHLIWSVNKVSVKEQVKVIVSKEKQKAALSQYLQALIDGADITNCLEDPEKPLCTGEKLPTMGSRMDKFAKCLSNYGAKIYGAYWNSETNLQKEMIGSSFKYIDYTECTTKDDPRIQVEECIFLDIKGYPTWVVDNKFYTGKQSLEILASLTGCSL